MSITWLPVFKEKKSLSDIKLTKPPWVYDKSTDCCFIRLITQQNQLTPKKKQAKKVKLKTLKGPETVGKKQANLRFAK